MNEPQKQLMKDEILKAIEGGRLTMRPKWQFITRTALVIVGIILIALTTVYITSFTVFILRKTGIWFVAGFGFHDFSLFLISLPWILITIAIIFILLLEILIKRYSFAYGKPFIYSALGIIVLVTVSAITIGSTSFHEHFFDQAQNGKMPFAGPFYEHITRQPENITVGNVVQIFSNGYSIQDSREETFIVVIGPHTNVQTSKGFSIGDIILVVGKREHRIIEAMEIKKPDHMPVPHSEERR